MQQRAEQRLRTGQRLLDAAGGGQLAVAPLAGDPPKDGSDPGGDFVYSLEVKRDYENQVVYRMTDELLASGAISPARLDAVRRLALAAHKVFACRDLSRVDIRCDRDGEPNFIEINPLPGLNPLHSDLVIIARGHGWDFQRLIARIFTVARERWAAAGPQTPADLALTTLDHHAANAQDLRRC